MVKKRFVTIACKGCGKKKRRLVYGHNSKGRTRVKYCSAECKRRHDNRETSKKYWREKRRRKNEKVNVSCVNGVHGFDFGVLGKRTRHSVGYVTTIEADTLVFQWDKVWFRVETGTVSSAQSQPEAYSIRRSNRHLKEMLMDTVRKHQKVEIIYNQHILSAASSKDEIVGFSVIGN
jgi:hypothetical protein